jgi:hypothetical protein
MSETFTFVRNGIKNTLPINPEMFGYSYSDCPCGYAKFRKKTSDTTEYMLKVFHVTQDLHLEKYSIDENNERTILGTIGGIVSYKNKTNSFLGDFLKKNKAI